MTRSAASLSLTRRALLQGSAGLALGTGASGCASVATRVAAAGVPEAVRPLVHQMADPEAAISSGEAWVAFCDALKPLARHVTGAASHGDLQAQTEGLRCLGRLVALGLDRFLEHADPRHPSFYDLQTATRKYLGDNPDQTYRVVAVDGTGTYRIRGSAAGAVGVEVGVYAGGFRSDDEGPAGGRRLVDSLDETTLPLGDDGRFELQVGGAAPGGDVPHLELADDANSLLIRTYFADRRLRQTHAMPEIERLDVDGPRPPVDPGGVLRGFLATAMFVDGSLDWWNRFLMQGPPANRLVVMPDDGTVQTPSRVRYLNGPVELEPGEAFVVEFTPENEPGYWSWVLQNLWGETPDWRDRPVVLNHRDLVRDRAGRIRIVVAHENPGVPNWMDMAGHRRLLMSLRWRGESALPDVTTRVLDRRALEELRGVRGP